MISLKYRPKTFDEVLGNADVIRSIHSSIHSDTPPHFFMLVGESGIGKTTIARIIAKELGITNIIDMNAADSNGVEFARDLVKQMQFSGFGQDKLYIIDECQRLTGEAQDILLKTALEEIPKHSYIIFCTTDPQKIKKTVKTRASMYELSKPKKKELIDRLQYIAKQESITISRSVLSQIAIVSDLVPRLAVNTLGKMRDLDEEEQLSLLKVSPGNEAEGIDLARALVYNKDWKEIAGILKEIQGDFDSIVAVLRSYMSKVLLSGNDNTALSAAFNVLIAANKYEWGQGKPGLVQMCYESMLRNKGGNK